MATFEGSEATNHHDRFGGGPDVLWVAGGSGLGSDRHPYQMPHFEPSFRNTTFDNRGHRANDVRSPDA